MSTAELRRLRAHLLHWYDDSRRPLPWRRTRDPYRVWVSEIMLQQTRVAAVLEYYEAFIRRFPDVHALARARQSTVLAAWSGLGYYRRARMMHAAARHIVKHHGGEFPESAGELMSLEGIGRYTASAIASISFGKKVAVVDGNVERILARLVSRRLKTSQSWTLAQQLLDPERPGDFNQAMMELGATICTPRSPACPRCPVSHHCASRGELTALPVKPRLKHVVTFALHHAGQAVSLVRRGPEESLMPGMWELPRVSEKVGPVLFKLRHAITTTDYEVHVIASTATPLSDCLLVPFSKAHRLPLTGLARKILRKALPQGFPGPPKRRVKLI